MPDGDDPKHPGLHLWWWNRIVVLLYNLASLCFVYELFLPKQVMEQKMAPYKNLLDHSQNLQPVTTALKNFAMDNGETGYDAVLRTLISFDPAAGWRSQERLFDCKMKVGEMYIKTFLIRAVHILWMEVNGQLPWSIRNYPENEIKGLFFEFYISNYGSLRPSVPAESQWDGSWDLFLEPRINLEASYKLHAIAMKLKAGTREQSVINCIRWLKSNLFHPYNEWSLIRYTGGVLCNPDGSRCPPNLSRLFEERIAGCHSPAVLLSELLRLLNIPAFPIGIGNSVIGHHGAIHIPALERFVHGDTIVCNPRCPSEIVLLTPAEMAEYQIDSMMFTTIRKKLATTFSQEYVEQLMSPMGREGTTLIIRFVDPDFYDPLLPPNVVAMLQQELPQFHIQYNATKTALVSQPVPIRTLEDFSASGSDLWY